MMQKSVFGCFAVLLLLSLTGATLAQTTPAPAQPPNPSPTVTPPAGPPPCPTVSVQTQAGRRARDGEPVSFSANIAGGDPKVVPTIIWSTSAGSITKGQGTRRIDVDTTGTGSTPDREIRAEVWVGGYAAQCLVQSSGSVTILAPAIKFGDFGVVDEETLKKNLDALSTYFSQSPDNLYVIGYAGRNSERGFALSWLTRMKEALVTSGLSPRRIAAIDGGFREEPRFDFWIVPSGAEPPSPTPTVKRSEIVFPKAGPRRKP